MNSEQIPIKDAKDALVHRGKEHLHNAPVIDWVPPAKSGGAEVNGHVAPRLQPPALKPLTVRSIEEIMAYQPDDADLILADGYLCKGERTVWLGQGGLGKSRLSIQLACCCTLGRDFLGVESRGEGQRWLFLQTENGMRRLKYDLDHMSQAYSKAEWSHIKEHVYFHTLEGDEDGVILLNEDTHFNRAAELISRVKADVVVIDPLRDSHGGDLNGDQEMTCATRNLTRLAKEGGRTDRALLVLHHALTGKAGAGKATGFDRSSFGRNSKVLQGWTRAQINIAPGSPDNSNVLVIASGKNNNFKEFSPFAVELDERTMTYHLKEDFDVEAWQAEISGTKTARNKTEDDVIRALLQDAGGRMEKKKLIEQARTRTGRGENFLRSIIAKMTGGTLNEEKEHRDGKPAAVFIRLVNTCEPEEAEE
ncbi:MAG: AAA family ATPase [Verrucomicrobiota bacterium]